MLMTQAERSVYHDKILSTKTYEDCLLVQRAHHAEMVRRTDSKGLNLGSILSAKSLIDGDTLPFGITQFR